MPWLDILRGFRFLLGCTVAVNTCYLATPKEEKRVEKRKKIKVRNPSAVASFPANVLKASLL